MTAYRPRVSLSSLPLAKRRILRPLDPARPLPEGRKWFAIVTAKRKEFIVAHWLEAMGASTLVPLDVRWAIAGHKKRAGGKVRKERREVALIPSIAFLAFPSRPPWLTILGNSAVHCVLGVDGEAIPLRAGEIERLQQASARLRALPDPAHRPIRVNGRAMVAAGALQGRVFDVRNIRGQWATVTDKWFGVEREMRVSLDDLEAA